MNTFAIILTVMAAQTNVPANQPVTLEPSAAITVQATTAKGAQSACVRIQKAMAASGIIAFCSPEATKTAEVTTK